MILTQENFEEHFNSGEKIFRADWKEVMTLIPLKLYRGYYQFKNNDSGALFEPGNMGLQAQLVKGLWCTTLKEAQDIRRETLIEYIKDKNGNMWKNNPIIIDEDTGVLEEDEENTERDIALVETGRVIKSPNHIANIAEEFGKTIINKQKKYTNNIGERELD